MTREFLLDPVWNALTSVQKHFAVGDGSARRYPAEVVPFAALAGTGNANLEPLEELLIQGEHVYLFGTQPVATKTLFVGQPLHTLQMLGPERPISDDKADAIPLLRMTADDAEAMVALTTLAFPGFFRRRTHEMGPHFGIRFNGELVAMTGERLAMPGLREISAVCTHPAHTGKGYARSLMVRLMKDHAYAGSRSFLHVSQSNTRAIALYERLGFRALGSITLWPVSRKDHARKDHAATRDQQRSIAGTASE
jgi:ribosomal protein S18 acetylase RimI-like enzyme